MGSDDSGFSRDPKESFSEEDHNDIWTFDSPPLVLNLLRLTERTQLYRTGPQVETTFIKKVVTLSCGVPFRSFMSLIRGDLM